MIETAPRRASFRRICIVALLCLSIASCAWLNSHSPRQVAFQRMLYAQVYMIILAAGFSMPVLVENAVVLRQIAPREWVLVQDAAIVALVISNFNENPLDWAPVALLTLTAILHRYQFRGGLDRNEHH